MYSGFDLKIQYREVHIMFDRFNMSKRQVFKLLIARLAGVYHNHCVSPSVLPVSETLEPHSIL